MRRILEVIFRRPIQLLIVIALLPLIGVATAYLVVPRSYQATASLWALRHYEIIGDTDQTFVPNPPPTPAESQATALSELLLTRDFALSVANTANLASTLDPSVRAVPVLRDTAMVQDISSHVQVWTKTNNLFQITYANRNPQVAQQVVAAVVQYFGRRSIAFSQFQGQQLLQNYQVQLVAAKQAAAAAAAEETQYLSAHPKIAKDILIAGITYAELINPNYALLQVQIEQAQSSMQAIQNQIAITQLQISALGSSADNLFEVIDAPLVASRPQSRSMDYLIAGGMGLVIALLACTLYIIILVRGDRTLYTTIEIERVTTYPVVMQFPRLSPKTVPHLVKRPVFNGTALGKDRATDKSH